MKSSLLAVVSVLAAMGCTVSCSTARLVDTWTPKGYEGAPYKRLMIVGLGQNPGARAQYENDFVDKLANYRIIAIASTNVVPQLRDIDKATVGSWVTEFKLDGVMVTSVSNSKPPRKYTPPHTNLSGWYGAWADQTEPAQLTEKFYLATDLFEVRTGDLVYSGVVEAKVKKGDRTKTIHAVIDELAADMIKRGHFAGP